MALTTAQLITLKADMLANGDMSSQPLTSAGAAVIVDLYNTLSTTDVWRTEAPVNGIYDAIAWTSYTPTDSIPSINGLNGNGDLLQYWCRQGNINIKQMNLQNMLIGRTTIDASKANVRAGLRDAVIAIPAGLAGVNVNAAGAGGINVLTAMVRKGTRFEKLFATVDATTGVVTAKLLVVEGAVSTDDVQTAREMV